MKLQTICKKLKCEHYHRKYCDKGMFRSAVPMIIELMLCFYSTEELERCPYLKKIITIKRLSEI